MKGWIMVLKCSWMEVRGSGVLKHSGEIILYRDLEQQNPVSSKNKEKEMKRLIDKYVWSILCICVEILHCTQ